MPDSDVGDCVQYQHGKEGFGYLKVTLRVLVFHDPSEEAFVALALEMDLRGYGDSIDSALEELRDIVMAQITFAMQQNDPSLIQFPADRKYFEMFEQAQLASLGHLLGVAASESQYSVRSLSVPSPDVIEAMKNKHSWANG